MLLVNFILIVLIIVVLVYLATGNKIIPCPCAKETYRDPIYMNRAKLAYDWYPKSHHSIYGFPLPCGSNHLLSGLPYTDGAY